MGRKTYDSLPDKFRPLPWRHNIIITNQKDYRYSIKENTSVEIINTIEQAMQRINNNPTKKTFIIWWSQIYQLFLKFCDELYITEIIWNYEGDSYFPEFKNQFTETSRENHEIYNFVIYKKI
jgi:dihydrofolate reductase